MKFEKQIADGDYIPNKVSLENRVFKLCIILFLLLYGSYGIFTGELYLAFGRGEVTLLGNAVYVAFFSFVVGSLYLALGIADHYDNRNNEHVYRRLEAILKGLALLMLLTALGINFAYTVET
ncbi:hypothetical protein KUL156_14410 [Alteromonas sp. KUL156]|nr:hypothetical protein KUL154_10820 [Alteromonas sp. KUL154]GFD98848.1 hypothetical protein KUL156_14410 [Alteromonas sp. KUL156]